MSQNPTDYFRYCPGEERIKLSDAVCLGRRRSNFPKCKGCPFNDDEKNAAATGPDAASNPGADLEMTRDQIESVFRAYDIRGRCPDPLDENIAWRIGQAVAQFLRSELRGYDRGRPEMAAVVVGRDMRKTSPALTEALIEGLRAGGSPVLDIGLVDTPQLYFAVNHLTCCGGVQVTASHNPPSYNGFKICGPKARPVSMDTGLTKICRIAQNTVRHVSGQLAELESLDLAEDYKHFVRGFLREDSLIADPDEPMKIVVDASNGMAGRWFPLIFGDVESLEVVRLNFEHNGEFLHDPNPLIEANLAQLRDRVVRSQAAFGVCFDGDADRCTFVDHQGQTIRGDLMTTLLARYVLKEYPGSAIGYDVRSSRVVPEEIRKAGGLPRRERCGHPYFKKLLADAKGAFGGELSGHYYFRENGYCDSALIAFATVVNLLNEAGTPLAELIAPLNRYAHSGELSFACEEPDALFRQINERYQGTQIDQLDGLTVQTKEWWFNLRASNTEPYVRLNAEADDTKLLQERLDELFALLGEPIK